MLVVLVVEEAELGERHGDAVVIARCDDTLVTGGTARLHNVPGKRRWGYG